MSDLSDVAPPTAPAPEAPPGLEPVKAPEKTAPAAPPAAPAETPPLAGPTDPDRWPRSAKEWDQFKQVRNENYRKRDERIAALEKELKTREERLAGFANAVDPKEHSSVREERDRLSEALRLAAVEKHPRFQAYYDGKLGAQVELAKKIVGPDNGPAIAALLKLPDDDYRNAQIEEFMGGLSPMAANRLGSVINSIDELRNERETEISRAREDYDKAAARQQADQQASQAVIKSNAEKLFSDTLEQARSKMPMLQTREGDAAWNQAVDQRVAAAKNILFGQENPDQLIRSALAAVSFPALLESHAALQAEHDKLVAQVAALRTATPTTSRGTPSAGPDGQARQSQVKPGSRPMQAAADWIGLLNQAPAE
jgi:hypothetical protein